MDKEAGKKRSAPKTGDVSKNMNSRVFGQSAKKQKGIITKLLLSGCDGFQSKWPSIPEAESNSILQEILKCFQVLDFRILTPKEAKLLKKKDLTEEESLCRKDLENRKTNLTLLKQNLVFGINEVTKGLEKDELRLLVADRSTKPFSMISHIPNLAISKNVPAFAVAGLSAAVGTQIGIQSLVAFGLKRDSVPFDDLFKQITEIVSAVTADSRLEKSDAAQLYTPVVVKVVPKDEMRGEKLGKRRKRKSVNQLAANLKSTFPNKRIKTTKK